MTKGKSLSDWWSGGLHRHMAGADKTVRLALALRPVQAVIRVIDDSTPPMTVDWSNEQKDKEGGKYAATFTNFRDNRIAISPLPITEGKLSDGEAIDVVTGFAMHEASHAKHSRNRHEMLLTKDEDGKEVPRFEPLGLAANLLNVAEDVRIEHLTSKRWPGFGAYFDTVLDYVWGEMESEENAPEQYGPDLESKCRTAYIAARYPDRVDGLLTDPSFPPEVEWWQKWQADYLTGEADVPTTVQNALDHLREDPESAAEMDEMIAQEQAAREAGEQLRKMIDRLLREGIKGLGSSCVSEGHEHAPLDAATAEAVGQMVREELEQHGPIFQQQGARQPVIRVRKPIETSSSKRAYVGRPDADSEVLRASLVFKSSAPEYDVKLQKTGQLDDEELWRFGYGERNLFSERVIESKPDVLFGLLVDMSGSMCDGYKLKTAQRLAQVFSWALHDQEGVETRIWGHTADQPEGCDVFRIWEKGDPLTRLGLIETLYHGNNADGFAMAYCASQMFEEPQPQKILLVLSDGQPSAHAYGGRDAETHMRGVVNWADKRGVTIIQIAIDEDLRAEEQARMFGPNNWVPYTNNADLARRLQKLMSRYL